MEQSHEHNPFLFNNPTGNQGSCQTYMSLDLHPSYNITTKYKASSKKARD